MTMIEDFCVTKTGMSINPNHAIFNVPGIDKIFATIKVRSYHRLDAALKNGIVGAQEKLMWFNIGRTTFSIPLSQLTFHRVAQGC